MQLHVLILIIPETLGLTKIYFLLYILRDMGIVFMFYINYKRLQRFLTFLKNTLNFVSVVDSSNGLKQHVTVP